MGDSAASEAGPPAPGGLIPAASLLWAQGLPVGVRALTTLQAGGVSAAPYVTLAAPNQQVSAHTVVSIEPNNPAELRENAQSLGENPAQPGGLNLALHVGDDPASVAENRRRLRSLLPAEPIWLEQVHGIDVAVADLVPAGVVPKADAAVTTRQGLPCVVMTADCLPVVMSNRAGTVLGVAHAGWRGLVHGVLEATLAAMQQQLGEPLDGLVAWLGPAIGPDAFEVGPEVLQAFLDRDAGAAACFRAGVGDRWMADLPALAVRRLAAMEPGVGSVQLRNCGVCTVHDLRCYSYRRQPRTGRMATVAWLA